MHASAAGRPDAPPPSHPQVAAQDEPALEPQQEVLADRLDGLEPPAVEAVCDPRQRRARVRRLHSHPLADESLQTPGGAVEGVSFWHGFSVALWR